MNLIQRKVKISKEQWLNDICQDVGEYIKRGRLIIQQKINNIQFCKTKSFQGYKIVNYCFL